MEARKPETQPTGQNPKDSDPLPIYSLMMNDEDLDQDATGGYIGEATDDINAAFTNLSFKSSITDHLDIRYSISEDTCLAHLKLLHAIQSMKEEIGYTDGLWNLWNIRGKWAMDDLRADADWTMIRTLEKSNSKTVTRFGQSRIREKRWALFVARAVDRYEAWWNSLVESDMLTEEDMADPDSYRYKKFPTSRKLIWEEKMLPPLDVLMIFHTHMLNPRSFFEDAIRYGLGTFWASGMPWKLIHQAIDVDFNYNVSDEAKIHWSTTTGRRWRNLKDPVTRVVKCPFCQADNEVPWTTCGVNKDAQNEEYTGLIGSGFGDGKFSHKCSSCGHENYKELLSVSKFVTDASALLEKSIPMPGTILDPQYGRPELVTDDIHGLRLPRTFPNRMIKLELRNRVLELIKPPTETDKKTTEEKSKDKRKSKSKSKDDNKSKDEIKTPARLSMNAVRDMIQQTLSDYKKIRNIDSDKGFFGRYQIHTWAGISTRKMMSRYWQNFSPFALDLCAAVMRQGVFIEKMVKIDWLHSPNARDTMSRLITKYDRFVQIMTKHPTKMAVPTLDVDLAWHTHQLKPSHYYYYTVSTTAKFIDHDDKIDEDKLSRCFEWTTKTYQSMFGEVYSECTCWYCETIRSSQISGLGKMLGVSTNDKLSDTFHASGEVETHSSSKSAHVSFHNAVQTIETADRKKVTARVRVRQRQWLDQEYKKAAKRAEKKGRTLPPKKDYLSQWGTNFIMNGPYPFPPLFVPGIYYGWDPAVVHNGVGAWANCAGYTCGNGSIAAGSCGGPGGCINGNGGTCGASGAGGSVGGAGGGGGTGGCGGGCGGS
ncbi:uncharacterized protein TrAFT101_002424 [Trichoderma asperellum]|uniref:uncharacterized protein n=1 Tax=Trichoderma asperellum TaxID=101201 RepID=UPI00332A9BAD|nr:hypothetical protein TrAFT101_002424 [Trichoderma asperellum]